MNPVATNLAAVRARIRSAERRFHRSAGSVTLLAVSKAKPISLIAAAAAAGQRCFGESYLQEAVEKIAELPGYALEWHFIGPIQSNKTRRIAESFAWVHSVDRLKTAERLNSQRPAHLPPLNICLQVNISEEPSKQGIDVAHLEALAHTVATLPRLHLRGLMAVPAPQQEFSAQRRAFATLRNLQQSLNAGGLALDTLSMGMSGDLEAAIAEGSTLVRVGTALFGERVARSEI
ncbi:MAG: YggS family pyridoxal phosphate-dependent enzyme [Candidatus Competibacteraceae bacterium]|nr:YggS family pyridoxal phosphate-dependent enzyme [Candidatus Competibacteraceae bacterium]